MKKEKHVDKLGNKWVKSGNNIFKKYSDGRLTMIFCHDPNHYVSDEYKNKEIKKIMDEKWKEIKAT
jgi:hypothetical protein